MSDVITFHCPGCRMPYRVAANFAGRQFACKQCQTQLTVPQPPAPAPVHVEPEVELGSGAQVMRKTTSGRTVPVNPTQVFAKSRISSGRLPAVAPPPKKKSSAGLVVAIVAVIVLAGGAAGAYALGVFDSGTRTTTAQGPADNSSDAGKPAPELTPRDRVMRRADETGLSALDLVNLLDEADTLQLPATDRLAIGRRAVNALLIDDTGFTSVSIMGLADRMVTLDGRREAESLYLHVIGLHRDAPEVPREVMEARERLGHVKIDPVAAQSRLTAVLEIGLFDNLKPHQATLEEIARRADDGWVQATVAEQFNAIVEAITAAEADIDRLRRTDPFRFRVVEAERNFKNSAASRTGRWITVSREPYVVFLQLQSSETEEAGMRRMERPITALEQFPRFFDSVFARPMELKRTVPAELPDDERQAAPIILKLFRDESHWAAHLRDLGMPRFDTAATPILTERGTGHVSLVYNDENKHMIQLVRALVDVMVFNHHPRPPQTQEEQDHFATYVTPFLNDILHTVMAISSLDFDQRTAEYTWTYFIMEPRTFQNLGIWRKEFTKRNEAVVSFGGPLVTAKQLIHSVSRDELMDHMRANLKSYDGWTDVDYEFYTRRDNLWTFCHWYQRGLAQFLFNWGPGGEPKYRDKFINFLRLEFEGKLTRENYTTEFERVFGIRNGDWRAFEADFTAYQEGK